MGVTDIKKCGVGLLEGVIWKELSDKRRNAIISKVKKLAKRYEKDYIPGKGVSVSVKFAITRAMHQTIAKKEKTLSADNKYWADQGWIKR